MKTISFVSLALILGIVFVLDFLPVFSFADEKIDYFSVVTDDIKSFSINEQKYSLLTGAGLTLTAFFIDDELQKDTQHWKGNTNKIISDFGNAVGHPIVDFSLATLLYSASKKGSLLEKSSFTALESVFFSVLATETIAYSVGRKRPKSNSGSSTFKPFSGNSSFPSAHAASSMAFFSTYSNYYGKPYSYLFYGAFLTTVFGRIYENRHYLSDTVFGSTIGYVISSVLYEHHKKLKEASFMPLLTVSSRGFLVGFYKTF